MKRSGKYNASPQLIDGHRFASKKEALQYLLLRGMQKAGRIKDLELQPKFPMPDCPNSEFHGYICTYIADFRYTYIKDGRTVVLDVKGMETPVFKLKRRLLNYFYPDVNLEVV